MAFTNYFANLNIGFSPFGFGANFSFNFNSFSSFMPNFNIFNFGNFVPYNTPQASTSGLFWGINQPQNFQNITFDDLQKGSCFDYTNISMPKFSINMYGFDTFVPMPKASSNLAKGLTGYNSTLGKKIADIALADSTGFNHKCATYVKNAIEKAGAGSYVSGHAYQMTDILKDNKNFKQIEVSSVDLKKLPAGCVLVYDKGAAGYSSEYGHTEITTGDGRAVSDGITNNLHKKPSAIFMPV